MPTPRSGEKEQDFISRCVPVVMDDGTAEDNEQAVAVCHSMWEDGSATEAARYSAKKGQQIKGRLWGGGGGQFVGGPDDAALANIGLERAQSDALLGMLGGKPVNSIMAEQLRNLGLLSPTNKLTEYGRALAKALKAKDADEAKRLLDLAKPKGKGGGGGGAAKKPTADEIKMANRRDVIKQVVDALDVPENILNLFFDFMDGATSISDELLSKIADTGLVEIGKDGYYKATVHGKKFLKAADKKLAGDAISALKKAQGVEESMNVGQIAKSAIETALAIVRSTGEISQERALKMLYALEADLAEVWKPGDGASVASVADFDIDGKRVTLAELIDTYREAVWTTAFVNDLPDSSFALILSGGEKDEGGKTAPRSLRKLPYKDADGAVDVPHLRNALARISQVTGASEAQISSAQRKLEAAAQEHLKTRKEGVSVPGLRELLERALALLPTDEAESLAESAGEPSALEDFTGDLAELGIDAAVETGRRAPILIDLQMLEPGPGNKEDNHYYPREVLARDIHVFNGCDIFATDHKENERNERTKVGRIRNCPTRLSESGAPIAQAIIYDPDQAEKARNRADAGELETLRCSIFGRGVSKPGKIDGKEYKIVEALTEGIYLEFVGKDGAGGHAVGLSESNTGGSAMSETEEVTEGEGTLEDIKESEPAPVEEPTGEVVETEPVEEAQPEPEFLAEAEVESKIAETNLPKAFKAALNKVQYADEEALMAAITEAIAEVKTLTGSGQPFGHGETKPVVPSEAEKEQAATDSFNRVMREVGLQEV